MTFGHEKWQLGGSASSGHLYWGLLPVSHPSFNLFSVFRLDLRLYRAIVWYVVIMWVRLPDFGSVRTTTTVSSKGDLPAVKCYFSSHLIIFSLSQGLSWNASWMYCAMLVWFQSCFYRCLFIFQLTIIEIKPSPYLSFILHLIWQNNVIVVLCSPTLKLNFMHLFSTAHCSWLSGLINFLQEDARRFCPEGY